MLQITASVAVSLREIDLHYVTAQGAGGQNVNKVATAVHLKFDIDRSSLPDRIKQRLRQLPDQRITGDGIVVIKSQAHRSREQNRQEALHRLSEIIKKVAYPAKKRKPTKPTLSSRKKRLDSKNRRGRVKALRGRVRD